MTTLRGEGELQAALKALSFMQSLASKLEAHHARWKGWVRPYRFRGMHHPWGYHDEVERQLTLEKGPTLMDLFSVEVSGRSIAQHMPVGNWVERFLRMDVHKGGWTTFASFSLWRADWSETPEMRGATCTLYFEQLVQPFFYEDSYRFADEVFGCKKVRFLGVGEVLREINAHARL
ncbi:MAG: hypothetical protein AAB919_04000 [Patescibacteria group bacterium]